MSPIGRKEVFAKHIFQKWLTLKYKSLTSTEISTIRANIVHI